MQNPQNSWAFEKYLSQKDEESILQQRIVVSWLVKKKLEIERERERESERERERQDWLSNVSRLLK